MRSIATTAVVMGLAVGGMAKPMHTARPSPSIRSQLAKSNATILVEPTMYQIFPQEPSRSEPAVSQLEVERAGDISILENIAVFEGIPAGAKTCTLGWVQAAKAERTEFTVTGNGLLATQQLAGLPEGAITWESVAPIVDEAVEQGRPLLHPDTTFWPDIDTAAAHIAGPVDCAETIYVKVQIDDRDGDGRVYLGQDTKNGLTLEVR